MPAQERSLPVDGRSGGGDQSANERRHQERMARKSPAPPHHPARNQAPGPADIPPPHWDDRDWDHEAARRHARRLLSKSDSGFHRAGDKVSALRRWMIGERWVRRLAIVVVALMVIFAGCFGALWWRLGAGPINLDIATPWLAAAIEENIGHGNTVEVGGTQIERAGRIRIAVRIRDIIVRDNDHAIVASAPKAEVRLSGAALLTGRLRAESLNLVDAELAVRITPDGYVTVSTGDTAKPLATGVASKRLAAGALDRARAQPLAPLPSPIPKPLGALRVSTASAKGLGYFKVTHAFASTPGQRQSWRSHRCVLSVPAMAPKVANEVKATVFQCSRFL